jgi:hypothetical protein
VQLLLCGVQQKGLLLRMYQLSFIDEGAAGLLFSG